MDAYLKHLLSAFEIGDWLPKYAAALTLGLLGVLSTWLLIRLRRFASAVGRLRMAEAAVDPNSKGVWLGASLPLRHPADYQRLIRTSIPIWVIANLKGGVGKTTTATNLFAHYAAQGRRALLIDLDFQASATQMALGLDGYELLLKSSLSGQPSKAAQLIEGQSGRWLCDAAQPVPSVPRGMLIPAAYDLANAENRLMISWLIGRQPTDVRYNLARALHSDDVQRSFEIILIDAPPRLTTAAVQAYCSATDVVIPTVLDRMSAVAVGTFADQLRINQPIWPLLRVLGVVGTMTRTSKASDDEMAALQLADGSLAAALTRAEPPLAGATALAKDFIVPEKSSLSRSAGTGIAYASASRSKDSEEVRDLFARLAGELDRRWQERT